MLNATPIGPSKTDGRAKRSTSRFKDGASYTAYLRATEYLRNEKGAVVDGALVNFGGLCQKLGLVPGAKPGDGVMENLAKGLAPNGQSLGIEGEGLGHRVGTDFTFSPPKSFSLAMAHLMVEGKQDEANKMILMSRRAAERVLTYAERQGMFEVRRGQAGVDVYASQGIVATIATHLSNRNLEPDCHHHCLVYNIGQSADGKWSAMDTQGVYDNKYSLDKLYLAELAKEVIKEYGLPIVKVYGKDGVGRETGVDSWEIAGFKRGMVDFFSTRGQEVEAYLKDHPHEQEAAVKSRRNKDEPALPEMIEEWRGDFATLARQSPALMPDWDKLTTLKNDIAEVSDAEIYAKLHQHEATLTKNQILARLAMEHPERGLDGALQDLERFIAQPEVLKVDPVKQAEPTAHPRKKFTETRYTTRGMVAMERGTLDRAIRHKDDVSFALDPRLVQKHLDALDTKIKTFQQAELDKTQAKIDGFAKQGKIPTPAQQARWEKYRAQAVKGASEEQKAAVNYLLTQPGRLQIVQGRAGTGKTTLTQAVSDAYQEAGYEVLGASTGWKASKQLEQDVNANKSANDPRLMKARAIAKLNHDIDQGKQRVGNKTVLIIDECSMLSTHDGFGVLSKVIDAGGKVIMEGDINQINAVGAGGMMRPLMAEIGYCELTEIVRQAKREDRLTAQMLYEHSGQAKGTRTPAEEQALGRKIFQRWMQRDQVALAPDDDLAVKQLVKDYINDPLDAKDKLNIGFKNAEVRLLNRSLRQARQEAGQLGPEQFKVRTQTRYGAEDIWLAVGDRIQFKGNTRVGASNSDLGTLEKITQDHFGDDELARLWVKLDNGDRISFYETDCQNFTYGYAITNHSAQGATARSVRVLGNPQMMDQNMGLVAFTRMKESFKLYLAEDEASQIARGLGRQRFKDIAIEEGLQVSRRGDPRPPQPEEGIKAKAEDPKTNWRDHPKPEPAAPKPEPEPTKPKPKVPTPKFGGPTL